MDGCSGGLEPLQMILSLEQTTRLLEKVTSDLSSCRYTSIQPSILSLSFNLKRHGPSLELHHGELLKRLQKVLRSACRDTKLDLVSRVHLLEIIEMRSAKWAPSQHITEYYKIKLQQIREISGPSPGAASIGSSAPAPPQTLNSDSCRTPTISSKPSSRLNVNAPDFCLGTSQLPKSIPDQPTTVLRPDSPVFISRHQHSPLVTYSGGNLKSNPGNNRFVEEDVHDGGEGKKEDNNSKKDDMRNCLIVQCDKIDKETFNVQSDNSSKYKATVHTEQGDIFMTSFSVDLLSTAKQILEKGLKDKIVNEGSLSASSNNEVASPELIYQNPDLLELATSKLSLDAWEKNVN